MNRRQFSLAAAATATCFGSVRAAATWPTRPVMMILSHPAGSGVDTIARLIGDRVSRAWGQPLVIENKPGGQNIIGAQFAARAEPNGYTFYMGTAASLVTNPFLFKGLPYDPQKDFAPVGLIGRSPFGLVVAGNSKITSFADLIARAKAQPGRVSIATEGPKTFGGITARLMNFRAGVDTNLVSYASVSIAVQDTVGGHTDALLSDVASTAQLIRQGKLRLLAVTTGKRLGDYPDVPAIAESFPGFEMTGWLAIVAPTATPAEAIQRFNRDLGTVLVDAEAVERIRTLGPVPEGATSPAQLAAFIADERNRWTQLSKEIGVLPE